MKFFLLINVKMPTAVGILTFINRKNSITGSSDPEKKTEFLDIFILMELSMKFFYTLGARIRDVLQQIDTCHNHCTTTERSDELLSEI